MGGKNAEVARSTGLFTHLCSPCLSSTTFPIEYQVKFDMAAFNINIKKNVQPIYVYQHLRLGEMVVAITCILHANILR